MAVTDATPPPSGEIGHSGTMAPPWASFISDSDDVPALAYPACVSVYHRMRTDSQVDALLRAVTLPIRRFHWALDRNGAPDEIVDLVASDLGLPVVGETEDAPRSRRRFNHDDHLRHALLALVYGHYFAEQVGVVDDDDAWRLRKLAPRLPQSITSILVADDGGLAGIKQVVPRRRRANVLFPGGEETIPVEKLVAYVWEREGANWAGRSMLRPLYRHWLVKDRMIRVDAMKNERYGIGIPTGKAPAGQSTAPYARLAQAIKAGETSGVGLEHGAEIGIEGIRGTLPDTLASIRYHDEAMARSFLAMFLQLGQTQTGSRALGDTFTDFFQLAVEAVANWYAEITNEHVIEDIVDWNWDGNPNAPRVVWNRADDPGPVAITDFVDLVERGVLVVDDNLRAWASKQWRLPTQVEPDPTDGGPPTVTAPNPDQIESVGALIRAGFTPEDALRAMGLSPIEHTGLIPVTIKQPEPATPAVAATVAAHTMRDGKGKFVTHAHDETTTKKVKFLGSSQTAEDGRIGHRDPTPHEVQAATNFETLQETWQDMTASLVEEWGVVRAAQIGELIDAIEAAAADGDLAAIASVQATVQGIDLLADALKAMLEDAVTAARAEAAAQGVTIPAPDLDALYARAEGRAAATATLMARSLSESAARAAITRAGDDPDLEDLTAGVRSHLEDLTDTYANDMLGGALTQAQNAGRLAVMDGATTAVTIYASELLDQNTCEECADRDGTVYDSTEAAEADYPTGGYKDCLGGPRCRGTLVAVYDEAESSAA